MFMLWWIDEKQSLPHYSLGYICLPALAVVALAGMMAASPGARIAYILSAALLYLPEIRLLPGFRSEYNKNFGDRWLILH